MTGNQIRPLVPTMMDEQAAALSEEFHPFQVWVDFRVMSDGQPHWHARRPHWMPDENIAAYDAEDMRNKLIIWKRENQEQEQH